VEGYGRLAAEQAAFRARLERRLAEPVEAAKRGAPSGCPRYGRLPDITDDDRQAAA
jgi:hypothetical protein